MLVFGDGKDIEELETQVNEFYNKLTNLCRKNKNNPHYTHEMYEKAHRLLKLDADAIQKSKVCDYDSALEEMLALVKEHECIKCRIL